MLCSDFNRTKSSEIEWEFRIRPIMLSGRCVETVGNQTGRDLGCRLVPGDLWRMVTGIFQSQSCECLGIIKKKKKNVFVCLRWAFTIAKWKQCDNTRVGKNLRLVWTGDSICKFRLSKLLLSSAIVRTKHIHRLLSFLFSRRLTVSNYAGDTVKFCWWCDSLDRKVCI